jgi:hypothetical protein
VNNNPDVNICDVTADRVIWNEKSYISNLYPSNENKDVNSDVVKLEFLSMYFTKPIHYGEHFRFIVTNQITDDGLNQNICLELVASNDNRLL